MTTKVFIAPGDSYHAAMAMFEKAGFEVVKHYEDVDLICFLGGTDVDPAIYGEERGPFTQSPDRARDETESALYKTFIDTPKVGICRGGQLLNILNGGKMIQHLGWTISGDRLMTDDNVEAFREVRVDHHQGIVADEKTSVMEGWYSTSQFERIDYVVTYPQTKSLCFQPHPEWGHKGTEDYFFELIERYFGFKRGNAGKDTKCAA